MRYLLHIGTNKTGTSTLQAYLGTHRDELRGHGIWYPEIGSFPYAHHDLVQAIKEDDYSRHGIDPALLKESAIPPGVTTVLLSSESFHTVRDVTKVAALFPPECTQVVLYLREHVSYLASWYQQAVQARDITCSFFDFSQIFGSPLADLVERWQALYGEHFYAREYQREKLVGRDIVEDFLSIALPGKPLAARKFEDKNPSISGNLLFLKLMLNHLLTPEENKQIVEELSTLAHLDKRFSGKMQVTERDAKRIAHRFAPDRTRLRQQFGIAFKPPREGLAGNPVPNLESLREDIALLLREAKSRGFAFHEIFQKKRDLLFPAS